MCFVFIQWLLIVIWQLEHVKSSLQNPGWKLANKWDQTAEGKLSLLWELVGEKEMKLEICCSRFKYSAPVYTPGIAPPTLSFNMFVKTHSCFAMFLYYLVGCTHVTQLQLKWVSAVHWPFNKLFICVQHSKDHVWWCLGWNSIATHNTLITPCTIFAFLLYCLLIEFLKNSLKL